MKPIVFWLALTALALPMAYAEEPLATPEAPAKPTVHVSLERVAHETDFKRPVPESLTITLRVTIDPEMHLGVLSGTGRVDKALDEKGNSLAPVEEVKSATPQINPMADMIATQVSLDLKPRPQNEERTSTIQLIEGVIPAQVVTKMDTIELDGKGSETRQYPGGVKATFTTSMTSDTICKVEYTFELPASLSAEERDNWRSRGGSLRPKVVDENGKTWLQRDGSGSYGGTRVTQSTNYSPQGGTPGTPKITFEVVEETKPIEIPFHLENVPLP